MRGPMLDLRVNPASEGRRFHKENSKVLRVELGRGQREILAKRGAMIAYTGDVSFDGEGHRYDVRLRAAFGSSDRLSLMRVTGDGVVWLADQAQDVYPIQLDNEGLTVDGRNLLAFDDTLSWDLVEVQSQVEIAGAGAYNAVVEGSGMIAVLTAGPPIVLRTRPDGLTYADSDAVIAWSPSLRTSLEAQVQSRGVWRPSGGTGETWQMKFEGQGWVVVQPSEMRPASPLGGLADLFGAGTGGGGQPPDLRRLAQGQLGNILGNLGRFGR